PVIATTARVATRLGHRAPSARADPSPDEELHQEWAGKLKRLLREMRSAMEQVRAAGATQLQRTVRDDFIARYEALLGQGLAQNPQPPPPAGQDGPPRRGGRRKQSPVRNLLDRLWMHENEVLLFLDDVAVPFDNNQAERDLRMVKVQQKVSGTFCSNAGADDFCRIRSVSSTWRKQDRSPLDALEAAFAGRSLSLELPTSMDTETTYLCAYADRRRAPGAGAGPALPRCLRLAPLPDPVGQRPRGTRAPHRPISGHRRPDGARCPARLQRHGA